MTIKSTIHSVEGTQDLSGPLVTLERHHDHTAVITVDAPPANTISWASRRELLEAFAEVQADPSYRCVVLTGGGDIFSGGGDLREDQQMSVEEAEQLCVEGHDLFAAMEDLRVPIIGAINGPATGGGFEFALTCDIRMASENAHFVAAGVNVGLIVSFWRLPRIVGLGMAKELLLTGRKCEADEAYHMGLVSSVHPRDQLFEAALAKADRIATRAPLSVEVVKQAATGAFELSADEGRAMQTELFMRMFQTDDHAEALRAFFERRDGNYSRR